MRSGILKRHWESVDGKKESAQIVITLGKVKEVMAEMHGGHLRTNTTIDKVRQRYYWLHLRGDVERWCEECDICAAS